MRVPYRDLPGPRGAIARPLVDVFVEGIERVPLACLVDTGSLHNRFGSWVAREAGIELAGAPRASVGLGGLTTTARTVPIALRLGETRWEAPVSFCDPWPWDFNIVGQEGFLRWFRVCFDAADGLMEITPTG